MSNIYCNTYNSTMIYQFTHGYCLSGFASITQDTQQAGCCKVWSKLYVHAFIQKYRQPHACY